MAVLTLSEYKTYAGIADSGDDSQITDIISKAQDIGERILGLKFETTTLTEWYSTVAGAETLQLRTYPVQSVTSIDAYYSPTDYTTISTDRYRVDLATGLVVLMGGAWYWNGTTQLTNTPVLDTPYFEDGTLNYKVVYVGGSASITQDIKLAFCQIVDALFANAGQDPLLKSEKIMSYEYVKSASTENMTETIRAILGPFANGGNL
jgi:hypothetical protein